MTWAAICVTYIRFRKAYLSQGIPTVEESKSQLQPYLAWYGLFWTIFLSTPPACEANHKAIFQGYLTFTRHNPYWAMVSSSWGFTLGPWMFISAFFILISIWLTRTRIVEGHWTWRIRRLQRIDLETGVAPVLSPVQQNPQLWRRVLSRFLNAL